MPTFILGKKPKNRIVSLDKDYIRPIVRGKEIKGVEFGVKWLFRSDGFFVIFGDALAGLR